MSDYGAWNSRAARRCECLGSRCSTEFESIDQYVTALRNILIFVAETSSEDKVEKIGRRLLDPFVGILSAIVS